MVHMMVVQPRARAARENFSKKDCRANAVESTSRGALAITERTSRRAPPLPTVALIDWSNR
jgi:hypothetical protein